MLQSSSLKNKHRKNATPIPPTASNKRFRSSSRCSRKLIRTMPSSSLSSSSGGSGGLGGFPEPPGAEITEVATAEEVTAGSCSVADTPDVDQPSPYDRFSSYGELCAVSPEGVSTPLGSSGDAIFCFSR